MKPSWLYNKNSTEQPQKSMNIYNEVGCCTMKVRRRDLWAVLRERPATKKVRNI